MTSPRPLAIPGVQLIEEIGRGVHGVVYRAVRGGRHYAVKIPTYTDAEAREYVSRAFQREAITLARIRDPALPTVMEFGWSEETPYLIMELVAGETLFNRLRREPIEEAQVVQLATQLLPALVKIHDAGLSHRDINTHNVLFDSLTTAARLVDFGHADATPEPDDPRLAPLASTAVLGPEADLFSLGRLLFECVTGQAPFADVDPEPLLERHADSGDLPPYVSRPFAAILRRLLGLDPRALYTDASRLLTDLVLIQRGSAPTPAKPESFARLPVSGTFGRERELDRLHAAGRAAASTHAQTVLIRGCAGSGKTHLLSVFAEQLATDHQEYLLHSCSDFQQEPFALARRIVHRYLNDLNGSPRQQRAASLREFKLLVGDAAPIVAVLSARVKKLLDVDAPAPRGNGAEEIYAEALSDFLAKLLARMDLPAIVVDDLQWLDTGSAQVLARLTDNDSCRVLFVLAARDDLAAWSRVRAFLRRLTPERVWELALEPLNDSDVARLVGSYLGEHPHDAGLARFVTSLSDRTPLSALETLRAVLDGGALAPHWGRWRFDESVGARLGIPRGAGEQLARRVTSLDPQTRHMLTAAAVLGDLFDMGALRKVSRLTGEQTTRAISEAANAMLVRPIEHNQYRFLHGAIREVLLERAPPPELRRMHQRAARALEAELKETAGRATSASADPSERDGLIYRIADHYAAGAAKKQRRRTLRSCIRAGRLAFEAYDNELALRHLGTATRIAKKLSLDLDLDVRLAHAEAKLRTGAVEAAVEDLRAVVQTIEDPLTKAHTLSRIAWAETQLDTDKAWSALEAAFETLGVRPPVGGGFAVVGAVLVWLRRSIMPRRACHDPNERRRLEVLCHLFHQAARLASYEVNGARIIQSVLRALEPAERLGPSEAMAKHYMVYSFVLTSLGANRTARRYLVAGEAAASETGDPVTYAHALQLRAAVTCWAGNVQESLELGARSLTEYGRWRELSEYLLTAYNQQQLEALRGRSQEAWQWLERAISRLVKHHGPRLSVEFIELSARAALTALGREREADALVARLSAVRKTSGDRAMVSVSSYGSRARRYTESGDLSAAFEELVTEVEAQRFNPKRVHLEVTEYYVHVAHARVHACLRATPAQLRTQLPKLRRAFSDLDKGARIPLLRFHALVIKAYVRYFEGDLDSAARLFSQAEDLGATEAAPWILYAAHRGRAHLLRRRGLVDAAQDQARLAEALAKKHRAAYRLRWIRQEFELSGYSSSDRSDSSSIASAGFGTGFHHLARNRGYLRSLLRIDQQTDLSEQQQARVIIDELLTTLAAERGYLFLATEWQTRRSRPTLDSLTDSASEPPSVELECVAARDASGGDADSAHYDTRLVDALFVYGEPDGADDDAFGTAVLTSFGDRSVLAVPLIMRGAMVGVVYLDRPRRSSPFTEAERASLTILADQIPLVFELGRSLRARDRAEENQRSTEKLEAVGRLAGGIAHDFNNMLSVIVSASEQIMTYDDVAHAAPDIETIQSAATRARDLTRQLLSFSRGQYLNPEILDLNELIARLENVFGRLLGSATLQLELASDLCKVEADPAQIDQVLTNLIVNAGDAMSKGGRLRIQTDVVTVTGSRDDPSGLRPGRYARVLVSDTGEGMDQATLNRAFEPFFTTKAARSGTGLGLATAYGIVRQSGGHITVESQVGVGTTFRIFLPEARHRPVSVPPPVSGQRQRTGHETILLVDDEPLVRNATRRLLRSLGYNVMVAESGEAALAIAEQHADEIDLVLTDVVMPQLNGLELARELSRRTPSLRVLFMSGFADGVLAERGVIQPGVVYLQKPINREALASSLRHVLDRGAA